MDWSQVLTTVIVATIAPLFLWLQTRQQNKRELGQRKIDADAAEKAAERQAAAQGLLGRQEVYGNVLKALGRFMASASPAIGELRSVSSQAATSYALGARLPVAELGAAEEALAVARLWAPSVGVNWLTTLSDALRAAAIAITPTPMTCEAALSQWEQLGLAYDGFARGAEADIQAEMNRQAGIVPADLSFRAKRPGEVVAPDSATITATVPEA